MKNVQVIDGALNCVYDIFAATEEEFALIFPSGQDIAFIDEVYAAAADAAALDKAFESLWTGGLPRRRRWASTASCFMGLTRKSATTPPDATKKRGTWTDPGCVEWRHAWQAIASCLLADRQRPAATAQ